MSNIKHGIHVVSTGGQANMAAYFTQCAQAGRPVATVKVLSDIGAAMQAKSASPDTITIWRKPVQLGGGDDQDNPDLGADLTLEQIIVIAYRWMQACMAVWRSPIDYLNPNGPKVHQAIDVFEITNEANPQNERDIRNYDAFYKACMILADSQPEQFKLALWSFSSGCPEQEHIEWMRDSLDYARQHGHVLAVHDGSVDSDRRQFQQAYADGTALRYRMFKQHFGWVPLVAITETYQPEGYHNPDWADWQWYLERLAEDEEVLGCAWFTEGDYEFAPGETVNIDAQLPGYAHLVTTMPMPPDLASSTTVMLQVKYANQNNPVTADLSNNDCGPACEAMVDLYYGHDRTVNEWYLATGAGTGLITIPQLITAASVMGYVTDYQVGRTLDELRAQIDASHPVIVLVNAGYLTHSATNTPHFVLVIGYEKNSDVFYIHDPYYIHELGGGAVLWQADLHAAWYACNAQGNPNGAWLILHPAPPPANALRGVGLGNPQAMTTVEVNAIETAGCNAIKLLTTGDPDTDEYNHGQAAGKFVLARLFFQPDADNHTPFPPTVFCNTVMSSTLRLYTLGVRNFEIHNEPNLTAEGWGWQWHDGQEFGAWFSDVAYILRRAMPNAKFGFPGLSPGEGMAGVRAESGTFEDEAAPYILQAADWVGAHAYWQSDGDGHWQMRNEDGGFYWKKVQRKFPTKSLYITEASCNNPNVPDYDKGQMYKSYIPLLTGVAGCFFFALSWPGQDANHEGWVRNGVMTDIPVGLGT